MKSVTKLIARISEELFRNGSLTRHELTSTLKPMKKFLLVFLISSCFSATCANVDTLKVQSASMNKSISNLVITPEGYSDQSSYSVVYLLHGAGGDFTSWISRVPTIQEHSDKYNVIIVCPDGGFTSWYFDSPVDSKMKYETYVSQELIEAVDSKYATSARKEDRAITGLSMGGHGAFYLAFKHQDVWGAAGSLSGGLDIRPFPSNWDLAERLGDYANYKENWEKNTVINLVHLLKRDQLKLVFECGTGDFFYEVNKNLHQKLLERNIPHDYTERPGVHNWDYWRNAIKYQLLFFDNYFKG